MKGKNTTRHQEDSAIVAPFKIQMKKVNPRRPLRMLTLMPDEAIAVYYFESGWSYPNPTYQVIVEFGDMEQSDYFFLTARQFLDKFGVDPREEKDDPSQLKMKFSDKKSESL